MNFKPMLAATVKDVSELQFPLYASPKLDGIRAVVRNTTLESRNLKPIRNEYTQELFRALPEGFDSELIVGSPTSPTCFRDTSSGVMSVAGVPKVKLYVFDTFAMSEKPFEERLKFLREMSKHLKMKELVFLAQTKIHSLSDLEKYETAMVDKGYEGVMLRSPDGLYKFGRSNMFDGALMKLKRFKDSEAKIFDVVELTHNENEQTRDELGRAKRSSAKAGKVAGGTMGALRVRDIHTGVEFDIGSGFTEEDRASFWIDSRKGCRSSIGKIVKYKYFPTGSKDKPRFPVFLGFRDKSDL